jgi:hypothetical protein
MTQQRINPQNKPATTHPAMSNANITLQFFSHASLDPQPESMQQPEGQI